MTPPPAPAGRPVVLTPAELAAARANVAAAPPLTARQRDLLRATFRPVVATLAARTDAELTPAAG